MTRSNSPIRSRASTSYSRQRTGNPAFFDTKTFSAETATTKPGVTLDNERLTCLADLLPFPVGSALFLMESLVQQGTSAGYFFELLVEAREVVEPTLVANLLNVHRPVDQQLTGVPDPDLQQKLRV